MIEDDDDDLPIGPINDHNGYDGFGCLWVIIGPLLLFGVVAVCMWVMLGSNYLFGWPKL